MVEAEHPTEPTASPDCTATRGMSAEVLQQPVPHALMIALEVVVLHVLRKRVSE